MHLQIKIACFAYLQDEECFQELDRKILEALAEKEAEQAEVQTARREKARADASWMKKVTELSCTRPSLHTVSMIHIFNPF